MNIVFWLGVLIAAAGLWYLISTQFFHIGKNVNDIIDNIKNEINKQEDEENE